jgi:hypothetical protein
VRVASGIHQTLSDPVPARAAGRPRLGLGLGTALHQRLSQLYTPCGLSSVPSHPACWEIGSPAPARVARAHDFAFAGCGVRGRALPRLHVRLPPSLPASTPVLPRCRAQLDNWLPRYMPCLPATTTARCASGGHAGWGRPHPKGFSQKNSPVPRCCPQLLPASSERAVL